VGPRNEKLPADKDLMSFFRLQINRVDFRPRETKIHFKIREFKITLFKEADSKCLNRKKRANYRGTEV